MRVGIERVHLEEDTGKTLHIGGATGRIHGATESLVDYNRAGIPLVEIVTKPVPGTGALAPVVARAYVDRAARRDPLARRLRRADGAGLAALRREHLAQPARRAVGHPDRDQERQLAAQRRAGGARRRCIRQAAVLDAGGRIIQETRHFHEDTGDTTSGRSKETATDYRYFPEPDLVPLAPDPAWVDAAARRRCPSCRGCTAGGCRQAWGLSDKDMQSVVNAGAVELIEATVAAGRHARTAPASGGWASWPGGPTRPASSWPTLGVTPAAGRRAAAPGRRGQAQRQAGPDGPGGRPRRRGLARPRSWPPAGLAVVSDTGALTAAVDEAIAANPAIAEKIRDGKVAAAGVLIGAVMKATRGQADAKTVRELILTQLGQG